MKTGVVGRPELLRVLRRAARLLTPVVVDQGPGQAKLCSFAAAVARDGAGTWLELDPIDGGAVAPARLAFRGFRVRAAEPADAWELTSPRLEALGPRRARVLVAERSRLARLTARRTPRARADEGTFLAVPTPAESGDVRIFPVVDLGTGHCTIEATSPLVPNERRDPADLISEGRLSRRTAFRVLETIPWCTPHGARLFRCRLALEPSDEPRTVADVVDAPARLKRLLSLAALTRASMRIRIGPRSTALARVASLEADELVLDGAIDRAPGEPIEASFELFGVGYQMQARVLGGDTARVRVTLPVAVRRRRWRNEPRSTAGAADRVVVQFRSPATRQVVELAVRDLSAGGLSFDAPAADAETLEASTIEGARLRWGGREVALGRLEVRAIERRAAAPATVHAECRAEDGRAHAGLASVLDAVRYPSVRRNDGTDFRDMLDLYRRIGLVSEYMLRNLEGLALLASRNWRRLHAPGSNVACTFVHAANGAAQACFTGVNAWDGTWLSQHFGAVSTAAGQATGAVQSAFLDHVFRADDARNVVFFVRSDNAAMNVFYERFVQLAGTPETVARFTIDRWVGGAAAAVPAADPARRVRPLRAREEALVARAAARAFGELPARALAMTEGRLRLPDVARRFRAAGLERRRRAELVTAGGEPELALLEERASPGVNFTWTLNSWWLLPIRATGPALEGAVTAAVARVLSQPAPAPAGDRFVYVSPDVPAAPLERAGFARVNRINVYAFNMAGLRRYYEYMLERYGEVGARARARAGRSVQAAS